MRCHRSKARQARHTLRTGRSTRWCCCKSSPLHSDLCRWRPSSRARRDFHTTSRPSCGTRGRPRSSSHSRADPSRRNWSTCRRRIGLRHCRRFQCLTSYCSCCLPRCRFRCSSRRCRCTCCQGSKDRQADRRSRTRSSTSMCCTRGYCLGTRTRWTSWSWWASYSSRCRQDCFRTTRTRPTSTWCPVTCTRYPWIRWCSCWCCNTAYPGRRTPPHCSFRWCKSRAGASSCCRWQRTGCRHSSRRPCRCCRSNKAGLGHRTRFPRWWYRRCRPCRHCLSRLCPRRR